VAHLPGRWIAQLGPFAILLAVAVYLRLRWDEIPPSFPVHWGIDGTPNGWSARTPLDVYWPLLVGAAILALISASSYAIRHLMRSVRAPASRWVAHDPAHRTGIFLLVLEFFLAIIFSFVGLLPLTGNPGVMPVLIATIAMLLAMIFLVAWLAKEQMQYARSRPAPAGASFGDGAPDRYWKFGMFYYNRDDAALFVEKRIGIGYTLNFGHASAWIIMAFVLLLPLVLVLLKMHVQ
jgi:uncharacterized membrane protein